ncbi:PREDICTED: nuclear pore complex protein Nup205 [Dufourea novaeangliae]|uniref:nuclear pore complex protein Nup205 n=1 Tax=Dufourea novaeangliae TaxID=178035 RepID=UPI0007671B66|nr:PREDICTED: nuclear pore complex protein Nup205 [Dufourea novaeangliae]
MSEDKTTTEDMWTPYKELHSLVERCITSSPTTHDLQYHEFTEALRNHRQNFLTLLKNPPPNANSREEIKKGATEGITLPGLGCQLLSKELVDETLIISDMYNLNEFMALDLLCTAQLQMPHHPGLPRGLTAILLYYDGKKALTSTLRMLVQARMGHSWKIDAPIALLRHITEYTNKMEEDHLLDRILSLLEEMNPVKEQKLLEKNRALGGPKHRYMVMKLYNDSRQDLADILCLWSAQSSLPNEVLFRLLSFLKTKSIESEIGEGGLDKVTLALIMSVLNAINFSSLHSRENGEELLNSMPLITDSNAREEFSQKLLSTNINWESARLRGFIQFAYAVALTTIKTVVNAQPMNITNEDERLLEAALSNKCFHFMADILFKNKNIYHEEFYIRYFHGLISDFILLMPLKVKDLRSRADESMRLIQAYQQEGIEPPLNLDNHFEYLMLTVAELYKEDPLKLDLVMDYWCHHSDSTHASAPVYMNRLPSRQVALFKFVRLAGEILPAGLFVPYLKMIASLASSPQAARQAFNFLKPNGTSGSTTISWDHFFKSLNQYYSNLRKELPPTQDTVYRQRGHPKGITPDEVKGLETVLLVVQVIAKNDEMSRIAICDHPGWKVLPSLIGLVSCGISIPLKAVLVRTLAALARSPESSSTVWQSLEAAQILSTVPTTSSYQPRGVQTELEEIESKKDEYPLTRAMLELLDVLTDFPIPRLLGMGHRNPGFDPYLHFIINTIFLKFHTRSYKNSAEKWEVAESCLKIFSKLIKQYEPTVEDFTGCKVELQSGETTLVNSAPGYHIMTQLHSKSELLHVILYILDKGCSNFDMYERFPGKKDLENGTLYCLEILERGLKTQHNYMSQLAAAKSVHKLLTGLSRLLLEVDPQSKKQDYMVNVAKYVSYNSWLPQHAFHAVGVIHEVTNEPGADSELLSTFTATSALATSIRHEFVECLDADITVDEDIESSEKQYTGSCKERILLLMMHSITRPAPNLAHYLLGFEITKDIRKTTLFHPGVLWFPRTCLHSILGILEQSLERGRDKITEACYCFLHTLAANNKTSVPVLRFLRTSVNQDFVQRHLSKLPFEGQNRATELGCMSWLLKIAAIELRVAGGRLQSSLVQRLVGNFCQEKGQIVPSQKLLMDLLHYIEFQLQLEPMLSLDFFDPSQIEMALGRCSVPVTLIGGPRLIDIRKLHSLITEEVAVTQNSATATQRNLMQQEVQKILTHALRRNQTKLLSYATVKFVEGWCQTTEMLFCVASNQQLQTSQKQNLLLNLSHDLLQKMTSCEALSEIKTLVSGTVLILLVNLRNSFITQTDSESFPSSPSNTTMMKIILSHILQWILNAGASSQKVVTHLYAALLNFLCVVGLEKSESTNIIDTMYVSQLDSTVNRVMPVQERSHRYATIQVINSFGNKLMDILCHNCSGGHDVCKMLALSCLDKILELDYDNAWILYLTSRGYLKHMIDGLLESDNMLRSMLQPEPQTLRPLYLYEAKMATFCRMASTRLGAESLLENKILPCVSSMVVFDHHPDVHIGFEGGDYSFIPSIGQRYQQIFLPALYLCDALLTTLGTENQSCAIQVCGFLQSHRDTIEMILRNAFPKANILFLKEIACLTGVISRSANIDMYKLVDEELAKADIDDHKLEDTTGMRELRAHLYRLQRLMLSLLCKFQLQPAPVRLSHEETDANQQHMSCVQIVANIMLYTRNQMQHSRMDQKIRNVLFEPHLTSKLGSTEDRAKDTSGGVHLGTIIDQLVSVTNLLHTELPHIDTLIKKVAMLSEMRTTELKEYLSEEEAELTVQKQRVIVEQRLCRWVKEKRRSIKYCSLIIEHALYILWSHLDFYMIQVVSRHSRMQVSSAGIDEDMVAWKGSSETLMELKHGLVSTFTDSFITQLLDTHNEYATVDQNFIEALVRRIKRLLQFIIVQ